jgi:8-oxo-dGTP diphosphatase
MGSTPRHSVSVAGVVVRDDGRVLVIQRRDNGHWEPPGGVLELAETFDEGVRREVAGVHVEVEQLTGVYKNVKQGIVALVFRCHPAAGEATATDESRRVAWFTPDEVRKHMTPAYAIRVLDALDGGVAARAHDGVRMIKSTS